MALRPEPSADEIRCLSLCSGYGGIELGLKIALGDRARTVCYVEREAYAAANLVARMEAQTLDSAPIWDDLATFDGKPWRGRVDIITAGYPCTPFSVAGKRKGADDPRHLWPHVARIIEETRPRFAFCENVDAHLKKGFSDVVRDLQAMGFGVASGIFSAEIVEAPHRRKRLFFLAYPDGIEGSAGEGSIREEGGNDSRRHGEEMGQSCGGNGGSGRSRNPGQAPDSGRGGMDKGMAAGRGVGADEHGFLFPPLPEDIEGWRQYAERQNGSLPVICRRSNGASYRVDRLRLGGNGVVPLVAADAFSTLAVAVMRRMRRDAAE